MDKNNKIDRGNNRKTIKKLVKFKSFNNSTEYKKKFCLN